MAAPLNRIVRHSLALSPKTLSPNLITNSPILKSPNLKLPRSPLARCLQYSNSPRPKCTNDLGVQFLDGDYSDTKVGIVPRVTVFEEKLAVPECKLLSVNTPERKDILSSGVSSHDGLAVLGRGAYGSVVKGEYKGKTVAVKIVKTSHPFCTLTSEENALKLHHPNIVRTIQVVFKRSMNYGIILMEDCSEYSNLHTLLIEQTIPNDLLRLAKWALAISEGISHCHQNGVIHLDIKPQNILVNSQGKCKICDFGNSVDVSKKKCNHQGTVAYTAPELFMSKPPEFSADIYSLGVTMWQLQTRRIPYEDIECREIIIYNVVKRGLRPPVPVDKNDFMKLTEDCWMADAKLRPTISGVIQQLQEILQQEC